MFDALSDPPAVHWRERGEFVMRAAGARSAARIADIVKLLDSIAPNERAKIDPPINFHGLRHTWASHAVMNGVPLMVVAKNLGHTDTRMVEKHYGHLAPSFVADAIRAGAPRFGQAPIENVKAIR